MKITSQARLLLITRNLPPLVGGMERLNYHIYKELRKEFSVAVAGPNGCEAFLESNTPTTCFPSNPKSAFLFGSLKASWQLTKTFRPNLVICGSGATAPAGLMAARRLNIPVAAYLHGLDIVSTHYLYRAIFLPAIRACDTAIVNSTNTGKLAILNGVHSNRIELLHPGVDLPQDDQTSSESFRRDIGVGNRPLLLFVGRLLPRKGLTQFILHCFQKVVARCPSIVLVVIGGEATEALNAAHGEEQKLRSVIEQTGLNDHVRILGKVDDTRLSEAYLNSQLLLFPVIDIPGDVEGFGMVAIEAAAHGLPTIAFANGGLPDAVSLGISGYLIAPGDYQGMAETIVDHINGRTLISANACKAFAKKFSWDIFGENLRSLIRKKL